MEKQNSQCEHGQPMEQKKKLVLHMQLRCGSLSITTPVSHLVNEFDVCSEIAGASELGSCQSNFVSFIRL